MVPQHVVEAPCESKNFDWERNNNTRKTFGCIPFLRMSTGVSRWSLHNQLDRPLGSETQRRWVCCAPYLFPPLRIPYQADDNTNMVATPIRYKDGEKEEEEQPINEEELSMVLWGRFRTAPIIALFIPGTPLKTTHLQKRA